MEKMNLSEQARAAQRAYHKKWRANHKEYIREKNRRYWEKKAAKMKAEKENSIGIDKEEITNGEQ